MQGFQDYLKYCSDSINYNAGDGVALMSYENHSSEYFSDDKSMTLV